MKKYFRFFGIAMMATALCVGMASCGDKDEDDDTSSQGGSGSTSMNITFDGDTWSPEASGYNYAYYLENSGNPFLIFRVFKKIEGETGSFPALQLRIMCKDGGTDVHKNAALFFCNYATNPGHIYEDYLQGSDGSKYTVYDYTFNSQVQGDINVTGFKYDASSMKVSFTADLDMISPVKYWGDNDEDGQADNIIDAKHCHVVVNNLQLATPPTKANMNNVFASENVVAAK